MPRDRNTRLRFRGGKNPKLFAIIFRRATGNGSSEMSRAKTMRPAAMISNPQNQSMRISFKFPGTVRKAGILKYH